MACARDLFLERIKALKMSSSIDAVQNKSLTEHAHNNVAKMLRNGLAVVGFAALEDFVKSRVSEVLKEIGPTGVKFEDLPDKIRIATTYGALSALSYQLTLQADSDRISYIQEQASKLASTASSAYDLTPYAFVYSQPNLKVDSIKDILKSFGINDPWGQMTQISSRLGLAALPLAETFKGAAIRRHKAAHVAHADTPQTDLAQFVKEALAIAISFDSLISHALGRIRDHDKDYLNGAAGVSSGSFNIRSVRYVGAVWKEFVEGRHKAVKVETDLQMLLATARSRALSANDLLVRYDMEGDVAFWECP